MINNFIIRPLLAEIHVRRAAPGGDPVTALVQQTGNGTSTDKGNLASRKDTAFRKTFLERCIRSSSDDQKT